MENAAALSRQKDREAKRKMQIIEAALFVFEQKGYGQARIEDIVAQAKMGKGTFYRYFKNKEDLVLAMIDIFFDQVMETLSWVEENVGEADLRAVFREEALRFTEIFKKNERLARFLLREARSVSAKANEKVIAFYRDIIEKSETTFALAMHAGLIEKTHPKVVATCIVGGVLQLYTGWLEGILPEDEVELIDGVMDFYLSALKI